MFVSALDKNGKKTTKQKHFFFKQKKPTLDYDCQYDHEYDFLTNKERKRIY